MNAGWIWSPDENRIRTVFYCSVHSVTRGWAMKPVAGAAQGHYELDIEDKRRPRLLKPAMPAPMLMAVSIGRRTQGATGMLGYHAK